jgi:F-type H+-transporting ATPase subunit b
MTQFIFFADIGGDLSQRAKTTAETFGLDAPHFFAQVISFGIVAFFLYRFTYRPVLAMLEQRRQKIAESVSNAEQIKAELARAEADRLDVLAKANDQATKLIGEARAAAARVQEHETQKAIAAAEQIITKAREAAAQDHTRMLADLKREVGRLVVQTTTTVTGKILTLEDQCRLAEETAQVVAS